MEDLTHTQPPGRTAHRRRVPPREAGTQRVSEALSLPEPRGVGAVARRRAPSGLCGGRARARTERGGIPGGVAREGLASPTPGRHGGAVGSHGARDRERLVRQRSGRRRREARTGVHGRGRERRSGKKPRARMRGGDQAHATRGARATPTTAHTSELRETEGPTRVGGLALRANSQPRSTHRSG